MAGRIFVISAPSGAGKSTLCNFLIKEINDLSFSVSYTTREPRKGEVEGHDYFFTDKKIFETWIKEERFVEYAFVHGNYYGTSKDYLEKSVKQGKNILLEIDVQGARQIREKFSDAVLIFINPPSFDELRKRLVGRGTDSEEIIKQRLEAAENEMSASKFFDYIIVNDDFGKASKELKKLIEKNIN
ncbi:MAG: guanylate kinase [Desulfobacteraceae bacterium]|nr:guanylate kinase [Desulfobacteraceae bacterium]